MPSDKELEEAGRDIEKMPDSAEQIVRSSWKRVEYHETGLTYAGTCYVTISTEDHPTAGTLIFMNHGKDKDSVFSAALRFTEEHEHKIKEARIDCDVLEHFAEDQDGSYQGLAFARVLERERWRLAALLVGWKAGAK